MASKKYKLLNTQVAVTKDPIEIHILNALERAKARNRKLFKYMAKPETKSNLKHIEDWKSSDFYNYFCALFQEHYKKEYRLSGSLVRAYQRIESFLHMNNLSNKQYKRFIDIAFSRFFKISNMPAIGSIVNADLLGVALGLKNVKNATPQDLLDLEYRIEKENEEVEAYLQGNGLSGVEGDFDQALLEIGLAPISFENEDYEESSGHLCKT